jgi:GT2 family glycosyltransferase
LTTDGRSEVGAVVVHHRRHRDVGHTVADLVAGGVPVRNIVLVDNSEQPELSGFLSQQIPAGASVLTVPNRGYGAAANAGWEWLAAERPAVEVVALVSHEVRLLSSSLEPLVRALDARRNVGAAGPLLVTGPEDDRRVWSAGGTLSRWLLLPSHRSHLTRYDPASAPRGPVAVDWLDGACVLYRIAALRSHAFSEDFFLYSEELEQQMRMRKAGTAVVLVPDVVAWQSSEGVPAFTLGRNLQLFYSVHGTGLQRIASVRYLAVRRLLGQLIRGHNHHEALDVLRGRSTIKPS